MLPAANNINTSNVLILVPSALFASVEVEGGVRGGGGTEGGGDGGEGSPGGGGIEGGGEGSSGGGGANGGSGAPISFHALGGPLLVPPDSLQNFAFQAGAFSNILSEDPSRPVSQTVMSWSKLDAYLNI